MKDNKQNSSHIIRIILLTVVALILGLSFYTWNAKKLTGNQMPMPLGYGVSIILSGSMEPCLSVDDLVVIKKTDSVQLDDIVVYQDGNMLVIHRVVGIDGEKIITQGDANGIADDPISMKNVKGVMVLAIPFLGAVIRFLQHPAVILLMVIAIAYLIIRSFRKEKEQATSELDDIKREIEELMSEMKDH